MIWNGDDLGPTTKKTTMANEAVERVGRVPPDFDRALWLDPLTFNGLVGSVLASSDVDYRDLFRGDGFAKPIAQLRENPRIAALLDRLQPDQRD